MFNRTPMIILTAASDSSSYNADINVSIILMQDGLSFYNIPRRGDGALIRVSHRRMRKVGSRVRISAATDLCQVV